MQFSKTELKVISEISKGNKNIPLVANSLKISISQIYRIAKRLESSGIITLEKSIFLPKMKTHVNMLLLLLSKAENLKTPLSGTGLQIYTTMIEPKTISEIEKETKLHKTTVIKKINQGKKMSLILKEDKKYRINEKIWSDVKEFFIELKKYESSIDKRIPITSIIYYKNDKEIIFSNKEEVDAEKTSFSAYEKYGIELLLVTNYYYLPKQKLTKKEIFMHSIYIIEKDPDTRHLIFAALFYLKFKKELSNMTHPIIEKIKKVLSEEEITGYPTIEEIKDRANVYNIRV